MGMQKQSLLETITSPIPHEMDGVDAIDLYPSVGVPILENALVMGNAVRGFPGAYLKQAVASSTDTRKPVCVFPSSKYNEKFFAAVYNVNTHELELYRIVYTDSFGLGLTISPWGTVACNPRVNVKGYGVELSDGTIVVQPGDMYVYGFRSSYDEVYVGGTRYKCILTHQADAATNKPGSGSSWTTYWTALGSTTEPDSWVENDHYFDGTNNIKLKDSTGTALYSQFGLCYHDDYIVYANNAMGDNVISWSSVNGRLVFDGEFLQLPLEGSVGIVGMESLGNEIVVQTLGSTHFVYNDGASPFATLKGRSITIGAYPGTTVKTDRNSVVFLSDRGTLVECSLGRYNLLDDTIASYLGEQDLFQEPRNLFTLNTLVPFRAFRMKWRNLDYYCLYVDVFGEYRTFLFDITENKRGNGVLSVVMRRDSGTQYPIQPFLQESFHQLTMDKTIIMGYGTQLDSSDPSFYIGYLTDNAYDEYDHDGTKENIVTYIPFHRMAYGSSFHKQTSRIEVTCRLGGRYDVNPADLPTVQLQYRDDSNDDWVTAKNMVLLESGNITNKQDTFRYILHGLGAYRSRQYRLKISHPQPLIVIKADEYVELPYVY